MDRTHRNRAFALILITLLAQAPLTQDLSAASKEPITSERAVQEMSESKAGSLQSTLTDPSTPKRLEATGQADIWQIKISTGPQEEWQILATLEVAQAFEIEVPTQITEQLEKFEANLVVGQLRTSSGEQMYVAGAIVQAVGESRSSTHRNFLPMLVDADMDFVVDFASAFLEVLAGKVGKGAGDPASYTPDCLGDCERDLDADSRWCGIEAGVCNGAAAAVYTICAIACGPIPTCQGVCLSTYLLKIGNCGLDLLRCRRTARRNHTHCVAHCLPNGGGSE